MGLAQTGVTNGRRGRGATYLLTDPFSQGLLKVSEEETHGQSLRYVKTRGNVGGKCIKWPGSLTALALIL